MQTLGVHIKSVLPQLMNNGRKVNPLDPWAKMIRRYSNKRKKVDEDHIAMMEADLKGALYMLDDSKSECVDGRIPYWPNDNIHACIKTQAKTKKLGKVIDSTMLIDAPGGQLIYDGPRTRNELWNDEQFRHSKKTRRGTIACRPIFEKWEVKFNLSLVDKAGITLDELKDLIVEAGRFVGLSDWPRRYGLFEVVDFSKPFKLDFSK